MNMSDMAHKVTDAVKRMTDRLTHRRGAHSAQQPSSKDSASDMKK